MAQYRSECLNVKIGREFLTSNDWPTKLSDPRFDRCYCKSCYPSNFKDTYIVGGGTYVIPRGYTRFGLRIDEVYAEHLNIWQDWLNCYHGTSIDSAKSIVEHRMMLLPGEETMKGQEIKIRPGHTQGEVFVFTTPTIKYAELPQYARTYQFNSADKNSYSITVVLQCKQKPNSFRVQGQTVCAGTKRICSFIENNAMEWKSKQRASIIPYAVLLRVQRVSGPIDKNPPSSGAVAAAVDVNKDVKCPNPYCLKLIKWTNYKNNQGVVLTCTPKICETKVRPFTCSHCSRTNLIHEKFTNESTAILCHYCRKDIFMSKCPSCKEGFNFCKFPNYNQATQIECTSKTCRNSYLVFACPHCKSLKPWQGVKQQDGVIITCKSCMKRYQLARCPICLFVNVCQNAYQKAGRKASIICAYNHCKQVFIQPLKERIRRCM